MSARTAIINAVGDTYSEMPIREVMRGSDAILSALRSAGFAPPLHTGAIHKALQDAFQAGVNEAFAGRYIRPSSDLVALKHKLCDAALSELLKAAQEDSRE